MKKKSSHETLSKPGLLDVTHRRFDKTKDTIDGRHYNLINYVMSELAVCLQPVKSIALIPRNRKNFLPI